jgi:hypothetical protein
VIGFTRDGLPRDIGKDYIFDEKNHPSLKKILNFVVEKKCF